MQEVVEACNDGIGILARHRKAGGLVLVGVHDDDDEEDDDDLVEHEHNGLEEEVDNVAVVDKYEYVQLANMVPLQVVRSLLALHIRMDGADALQLVVRDADRMAADYIVKEVRAEHSFHRNILMLVVVEHKNDDSSVVVVVVAVVRSLGVMIHVQKEEV